MRVAILLSLVGLMLVASTSAVKLNDILTTFRLRLPFFGSRSDEQPDARMRAKSENWMKVASCRKRARTYRTFTGNRWVQPSKDSADPEMIIIFNAHGEPAGMQSLVPANNFVGWDCTENEYYIKENITYFDIAANTNKTKEFCMTTAYFYDPWDICNEKAPIKYELMIQKGEGTRSRNLVKIPMKYEDAIEKSSTWKIDNYYRDMGHHVTLKDGRDDCKKMMPIQALYSHFGTFEDGACEISGLVWAHVNVNATGPTGPRSTYEKIFGSGSNGWEEPGPSSIKKILTDVPKCVTDAAKNGLVRTMHVFLATPTAAYCPKDKSYTEWLWFLKSHYL